MSKRSATAMPGFTVVELIVVISVISIMAVIGMVSYQSVLDKSHFTTTKTDMLAMKTAIEKYYAKNGAYPYVAGGSAFTKRAEVGNAFIDGLVPNYYKGDLPDVMYGDKTSAYDNTYAYRSDGTNYKLLRVAESGKSLSQFEIDQLSEGVKDPNTSRWNETTKRAWGYWTSDAAGW